MRTEMVNNHRRHSHVARNRPVGENGLPAGYTGFLPPVAILGGSVAGRAGSDRARPRPLGTEVG